MTPKIPMPTISVSVGGTEVKEATSIGRARESPCSSLQLEAPARSESSAGDSPGIDFDRRSGLGGQQGNLPADVNHDDLHGTLAVCQSFWRLLHAYSTALGGLIMLI
jgi:hypothetical protein